MTFYIGDNMIVLNLDLDNTIIYSYKHDIGVDKINVEMNEGREISFVTARTMDLLKCLNKKVLIVPTTTRTQEQYERIDLKIGNIVYALVCNGGILLENGIRNEEWLKKSKTLIESCAGELKKACYILENIGYRYFEIRYIEELFVFTKCHEPENVVMELKKKLDTALVDVFNNGDKVYVVPYNLNKGIAISRFKKYIKADRIIASGDSEFDIPMVKKADIGIVPYGFAETYNIDNVIEMKGNKLFSEEMLSEVMKIIDEEKGLL